MSITGPLSPKHLVLFDCDMLIDRQDISIATVTEHNKQYTKNDSKKYLMNSLSKMAIKFTNGDRAYKIATDGLTFLFTNCTTDNLFFNEEKGRIDLYKVAISSDGQLNENEPYKFIESTTMHSYNMALKTASQMNIFILRGKSTFIIDKFGNKLAKITGLNPKEAKIRLVSTQNILDKFIYSGKVYEFARGNNHFLLIDTGNRVYCPYHNLISTRTNLYKEIYKSVEVQNKQLVLCRILDLLKTGWV